MPYPDNLDRHFVVDPTKYDFYVMDCYRHLAEDRMAESLASELIRASTDFDGTERAPTRQAEETWKQRSIRRAGSQRTRMLLPSLPMVSRDLTRVLNDRYPDEPETLVYLDQIQALSARDP